MAEKKELALVANNISSSVISRTEDLTKTGMELAKGYNANNAIRASMLILQDAKTRDGKLVLEACSQNSIARALFNMVVSSLDVSKGQGYFIPYGNELKFMESYFGSVTRAKRANPDYTPIVKIIYEGDEFEMHIDAESGETKVTKHTTSFENLDKPVRGAYTWVQYSNGKRDLLVMTMADIQKSWAQSSNGASVAKKFPIEMIKRTLIKRACKMVVNTDLGELMLDDNGMTIDTQENNNSQEAPKPTTTFTEFEEVQEVVEVSAEQPKAKAKVKAEPEATPVDTETGEIFNEDNDEAF